MTETISITLDYQIRLFHRGPPGHPSNTITLSPNPDWYSLSVRFTNLSTPKVCTLIVGFEGPHFFRPLTQFRTPVIE